MTTFYRRSLHVPGLDHGKTPIPMASRIGHIIFTSNIAGKTPGTNVLPTSATEQAEQAFANLEAILKGEGATMDNVGMLEVMVKDESYREAINVAWLKHFPDAESRPARHTAVDPNIRGGGALLQIRAVAVIA